LWQRLTRRTLSLAKSRRGSTTESIASMATGSTGRDAGGGWVWKEADARMRLCLWEVCLSFLSWWVAPLYSLLYYSVNRRATSFHHFACSSVRWSFCPRFLFDRLWCCRAGIDDHELSNIYSTILYHTTSNN
jgi:hypothetical protein